MSLDLDTVIFVSFLAMNLGVGLFYSRGVGNTAEHAVGNRNFSTRAITATIIATYVGAGVFASALTESYRQGLYFIIPVLFEPIALIIFGIFCVPRMAGFFGSLSVAETMGTLYGKNVRIITAICAIFSCAGIVALQFMVATSVMKNIFGISSFYALTISAVVVILYSSFGGIKAVTFTDILQFLTFTAVLPLISFGIWKDVDATQVIHSISNNPLFDLKEVLHYNNPRFLPFICLALFFMVPACDAAYLQRVSIAKGVKQSQKPFIIGGLVSTALLLMICATGVLLLSVNPDLEPNHLLEHIMNNYTYTGLTGLTAICLMSIIMSTADSNINTGAVLFMHDIVGVLKLKSITPQIELLLVRIVAVAIGFAGFWIAHSSTTVLDTIIMTMAFYMPVVLPPLFLAIFGFYSSERVALAGMVAAALTCWLWTESSSALTVGFNDESLEGVNEVIPGMVMNLIVFIIGHFVCGRPKGLINLEHKTALDQLKQRRMRFWSDSLQAIKEFNFIECCKVATPKNESVYLFVGIFSIMAVFASTYSLSDDAQLEYTNLLNTLHYSILTGSSILCLYIILPRSLKRENLMAVFWVLILPFLLVATPFIFLMISDFDQFAALVFLISILVLGIICRWQVALLMMACGIYGSIALEEFTTPYLKHTGIMDIISQFKIIYAVLLAGGIIIAFLKPKQEAEERSEEMVEHLSHALEDQNARILELSTLKQTFLRNLQHETNTPITGVYSMSQALHDCYDKLSDKERKAAINTIITSAERLISYANNLIDVSKLSSSGYNLNMRKINLSNLLEEALRKVRRLYIIAATEEDREVEMSIEPNISILCDEYYVRKSFENMLINAIQYCRKGKITISLSKSKAGTKEEAVEFSIRDSGIGIPKEELVTIFDPFTTSSKTTTPAGGRGMGLTLAKAVAQAHKGTITADSDGKTYSLFTMRLPA